MSLSDRDLLSIGPDAPRRWHDLAVVVVGAALLGLGAVGFGQLGEGQGEQVLRMGIVALMAASLALVNGAAGQFSLGHAAFQGVGAYVAAAVFALAFSDPGGGFSPSVARGWPLVLGARGAIVVGGVAAAVVGGVVALPCLRLRGDYLAIVTLGFNVIVGVVIRSLGKLGRVDLRGAQGFNEIPRNVAGGYGDISITLAIALYVCHRLVHRGRGLAFAAVRDDEIAAEAVGVDTTRTKVAAFVISAFFAGLAGGLYAFKTAAINDVAFDPARSFDYVVMVILGGNGNILGAAFAGAALTWLNDQLRGFESWRPVAYSFALIIIIVSRSPGLLKILAERLARFRSGAVDARSLPSVEALAALSVSPLLAGTTTPTLQIRGMTVRFGGLTAVDGLDLEIAAGECVGLIGPNGAGKSTVFNAITGVYRPQRGSVEVSGQSIVGLRPHAIARTGAARTFQNIRLFSSMTALENVRAAAWSRHRGGLFTSWLPTQRATAAEAENRRVARNLLDAMGLGDVADLRGASLPYGAQRRLEIARALATQPRLLLLDEPAAGMNPSEKRALAELLRAIHDRLGVAILLIEHDLGLVSDVCSRIAVLDYGKRIALGTPEEIRADPRVIEAYLGPEAVEDRA